MGNIQASLDVAVERRLEVDQHEAQLFDLASEVATGQPVREFVHRHDHADHQPDRDQTVQAQERQDVAGQTARVRERNCESCQDGQYREDMECRRKAPAHFRQQPIEHAVRVQREQAQVEKVFLLLGALIAMVQFVASFRVFEEQLFVERSQKTFE